MANFFAESKTLEKGREGKGAAQVGWITFDAFEIGIFIANKKRFFDGLHLAHLAEEDDFPGELTFVSVEVRLGFYIDPNGGSRHRTFCRGRPRRCLCDEH